MIMMKWITYRILLYSYIIVLILQQIILIYGQENAQLQVAPSLFECYEMDYFLNRDNRLPHNMETLITLIEKIENTPYFDQDIRQLTISLLHRFRQDGIQRASGILSTPGLVLPYSPIGFQFSKYRILLTHLIPGNAIRFPNDTLTRVERCSLHFMLSSSLEMRTRGDEHDVCNKLAEYRAKRTPRHLKHRQHLTPLYKSQHQHQHYHDDHGHHHSYMKKSHNKKYIKVNGFRRPRHIRHYRNNFIGDVEIMQHLPQQYNKQKIYHGRSRSNLDDYDFGWTDIETGTSSEHSISQCPVENGVIYTQWGTISAGTLIAGIAAGLQPQTVQLRTLLASFNTRRTSSTRNLSQMASINIDNRWAATLAGDLAEIALIQAPTSLRINVGGGGAWNSTIIPKWYFLSQRHNLELTDAEIRGGIDGLLIAMNIANWRNQASNLKLSQLLRMYYSHDGVFGSDMKACNRKENFINFIPINAMIGQTSAFAQVLDREMQLRVTLTPEAIANFSMEAAHSLNNYIPQNMNDVSCRIGGTTSMPQDASDLINPMTNLYVYLDTSWPFNDVVEYLSYIFQHLNVKPYGSTLTLLSSADGSIIVNTTNYLSDIFTKWNRTTHNSFKTGLNLPGILRTIQDNMKLLMDEEKRNSSSGGLSLIALIVPYMAQIPESDQNYAIEQLKYIREEIPDLNFIYYSGGAIERFRQLVKDPSQDLYNLMSGTSIINSAGPVLNRIKKIPRRLINSHCGSTWSNQEGSNDNLSQYIQPGYIDFYRLASNYFYRDEENRYVKIHTQNSQHLIVCTSRSIERPQQNATDFSIEQQTTCHSIQNNIFQYDLSNACNDYWTIHECPPLYISVQAAATATTATTTSVMSFTSLSIPRTKWNGFDNTAMITCTEAACPTPYHIRYTINLINLGCYNNTKQLTSNLIFMALIYLLRQFFQ